MRLWATYFDDDLDVTLWSEKPKVKSSLSWHGNGTQGYLSVEAFLAIFGPPMPAVPRELVVSYPSLGHVPDLEEAVMAQLDKKAKDALTR